MAAHDPITQQRDHVNQAQPQNTQDTSLPRTANCLVRKIRIYNDLTHKSPIRGSTEHRRKWPGRHRISTGSFIWSCRLPLVGHFALLCLRKTDGNLQGKGAGEIFLHANFILPGNQTPVCFSTRSLISSAPHESFICNHVRIFWALHIGSVHKGEANR